MKSTAETTASVSLDLQGTRRWPLTAALIYVAAATALFALPLTRLVALAIENSLHSHLPLIPFVAGYLLHLRRPTSSPKRSVAGAVVFLVVSLSAVAIAITTTARLSDTDQLTLMTLAYVASLAAGGFLLFGNEWMKQALFPLSFLAFMIPLPDAAVYWIERGSVLASAEVSAWMFEMTGTPLVRDGTVFAVPGFVFEVAQECSGIRSSWVLLITSIVAANQFLNTGWRRVALVLFTLPLAIVRNAARILTIGLLCVHIGPHMIDSVIHTRGGPLFFALSMIPLFAFLVWLRRSDRRVR